MQASRLTLPVVLVHRARAGASDSSAWKRGLSSRLGSVELRRRKPPHHPAGCTTEFARRRIERRFLASTLMNLVSPLAHERCTNDAGHGGSADGKLNLVDLARAQLAPVQVRQKEATMIKEGSRQRRSQGRKAKEQRDKASGRSQ